MTLAKRTMQHPGTRPLAWLLMAGVLTLTWGVAPRPAAAQEQEARSAVVLDFASDQPGAALLGRKAGAALQLQLAERQYTVRSRAEVIDVINRLGLREPFESDEIRKLNSELDARQIFTGRVVSVEEGTGPPNWVRVLLRVEVYDGPTGDLVNGAVVEGFERGTGREDRETLRDAAVERAVSRALGAIEARSLLSGAVLQHQPQRNLVLINRGSRAGVMPGMMFDIYRVTVDPANPTATRQVKVGRIRVTETSADDAMAEVTEAPQGIQSNDVLREVFTLPEAPLLQTAPDGQPIHPPSKAPARGGKGAGGLIAGVLGTLAGIGLLVLLLSMKENTNRDAPRVDQNNGAYLRQATPGQNPSVVVEWGDKDWSPPANFIGGYFVYRGQSDNFAAVESEAIGVVPGAAQRSFADDPTWNQIETTIPVRFSFQQGEDVEQVEEELDVTIIHFSPQPGQTYFYKVRRIGPPAVVTPPSLITTGEGGGGGGIGGGGGGIGGGGGGIGGLGRSRASRDRSAWMRAKAQGKILSEGGNIVRIERRGRRVHRQVTSIPPDAGFDTDLNPQADNDLGITNEIGLSDASPAVGPVTYLVPPDLRAPSDNNQAQRVDDITFEYQGVLGATEYVLQLSRNVNFSPLVFQSAAIQTTASTVLSFRYNNAQAGFTSLAPNTTYFWRVGTRSTFRNQPAPRPDGYVFSRVFTFTTADQPPAAP